MTRVQIDGLIMGRHQRYAHWEVASEGGQCFPAIQCGVSMCLYTWLEHVDLENAYNEVWTIQGHQTGYAFYRGIGHCEAPNLWVPNRRPFSSRLTDHHAGNGTTSYSLGFAIEQPVVGIRARW